MATATWFLPLLRICECASDLKSELVWHWTDQGNAQRHQNEVRSNVNINMKMFEYIRQRAAISMMVADT